MRISKNITAFTDGELLSIVHDERNRILADFRITPTGEYSDFVVEVHSSGGFVWPHLLSCWAEGEQVGREVLVASISHELVHYELQIDCLINPSPSAFVNEGVAQSYAEGSVLARAGSSYGDLWAAAKFSGWQEKMEKAIGDDEFFLANRMTDRALGVGGAALFEWMRDGFGYGALVELFARSRPSRSCAADFEEICGRNPVAVLEEIAGRDRRN